MSAIAMMKLLFLCTYVCEQGFPVFTSVKMESRNRIDIDCCLILAISNIHPWIQFKKRPIHLIKRCMSNGFQVFMCDIFIKIRNIYILSILYC